jgi:hypothetical protein
MFKPAYLKGLMIIAVSATLLAMPSCSGDGPDPDSDEIVVDDDYYEFQDFNLSEYDIPAYIKLPDETANIGASTKPEVVHIEDDIQWEIKIGTNFQLIIEDYGDINDLIEVEKKELADKKFFKVKYLIDEKDLILYERTLMVKGTDKASPTVGVEHKTYHVYASKTIDGITYELQSREEGYEKVIIELMAKSIKSFRPIGK